MKLAIVVFVSLLLLSNNFKAAQSLSFFQTKKTVAKPIKKVAIIGSGISGLAVTNALINNRSDRKNKDFELSIYDARPSLDASAGAGIQLNGGLAVLGKINPALREAVYKAGMPQTGVQSKCKPWFSKSTASTDNMDTLLKLDLMEVISSAGGETSESLIETSSGSENGRLWWVSIMRGALQQALYDEIPNDNEKIKFEFDKNLLCICPDKEGEGIKCQFSDGSESGPFDLVIGCDGINSAVKSYVDKKENKPAQSSDTDDKKSSAIYSGIRIRYAVRDGDDSAATNDGKTTTKLTQHFGDGAYALHGKYGAGNGKPITNCAFLVYQDNDYIGPFRRKEKSDSSIPVDENADWSQDNKEKLEEARKRSLQQLQEAGLPANIEDDLGGTFLKADRFFELGVYFHNPFGRWSRNVSGSSGAFAVLCGDAAHALPPFLGQGSNQAIQDAYCLVEKIFEYNEEVESGEVKYAEDMQEFLSAYQQTRFPSTFGIFWKSAFLGYLETGGNDGLFSKFRDVFFKTMGVVGVAERVLLSAATPKT